MQSFSSRVYLGKPKTQRTCDECRRLMWDESLRRKENYTTFGARCAAVYRSQYSCVWSLDGFGHPRHGVTGGTIAQELTYRCFHSALTTGLWRP
eukprot:5979321-Pyramimonas_sp.AAC.1